MLLLGRNLGESIVIGDNIYITFVESDKSGQKFKLAIDAPRKEILGLPAQGDDLSIHTVLHKDPSSNTKGTTFSVDLHNTVFGNNSTGKDMTLTIDGEEIAKLTGDDGGALSGKELVDAVIDQIKANSTDGQTAEIEIR